MLSVYVREKHKWKRGVGDRGKQKKPAVGGDSRQYEPNRRVQQHHQSYPHQDEQSRRDHSRRQGENTEVGEEVRDDTEDSGSPGRTFGRPRGDRADQELFEEPEPQKPRGQEEAEGCGSLGEVHASSSA